MAKYKVEITGMNTSDLESIPADEMKKLFVKCQEGDLFARELLIQGNLKLVLSILKRFYQKCDNLDDLFQIGCVGLIKAIDHFDLSYDVKFSTYAVPMILGEIKRYIRDNTSIRISRSLKDLAYKVLKLKEDYFSSYGKDASVEYLSHELGVSEYEIDSALLALKDPISMYEAIYNDGGDTIYLYDQIEDKKENPDYSYQLALDEAINDLKTREKYI